MDRIVDVLPPTSLNFSSLATASPVTIPIAQRVPTFGAREVTLVGRLHSGTNFQNAASTLQCSIQLDAWTSNDPATQFQAALNTGASFTFSAPTAPAIKYAASSIEQGAAGGSFGKLVAVTVTATNATVGSNLVAVLSLQLIFKDAMSRVPTPPWHFRGYEPGSALG
jgi:hypothetical protein